MHGRHLLLKQRPFVTGIIFTSPSLPPVAAVEGNGAQTGGGHLCPALGMEGPLSGWP